VARRRRVLELLEMQRQAMLMYTSCGWFFDDVSGIEATQVLAFAARCIELAEHYGPPLEAEMIERLRAAPSNQPELADGAGVWRRLVVPLRERALLRGAPHDPAGSVAGAGRLLLERLSADLLAHPDEVRIDALSRGLALCAELGVDVDRWQVQTDVWRLLQATPQPSPSLLALGQALGIGSRVY
jgi:hypothetical protein